MWGVVASSKQKLIHYFYVRVKENVFVVIDLLTWRDMGGKLQRNSLHVHYRERQ